MTAAAETRRTTVGDAGYRVAVLGDSRVFDTYYATEAYAGSWYGYHRTFPHLLQRMLGEWEPRGYFDCVHIPDHFRGRTVENNILRLAMIDPECVVLCDAIWESLVSKKHFAEYAEGQSSAGGAVPEYSDALLIELYEAGKLSLSPARYAERIGRIVSWFTRRRRRVIWLTTPIPPVGYLDGLHYAGNYRPVEGWHRCLARLNEACGIVVADSGGEILDLDALMQRSGGAETCLIDQWHFTKSFHDRIATALAASIVMRSTERREAGCISRRVMVPGRVPGLRAVLVGSPAGRAAFKEDHAEIAVIGEGEAGLPVSVRTDEAITDEAIIVLVDREADRGAMAAQLRRAPSSPVVVYAEELRETDNPAGADRSTFGNFK